MPRSRHCTTWVAPDDNELLTKIKRGCLKGGSLFLLGDAFVESGELGETTEVCWRCTVTLPVIGRTEGRPYNISTRLRLWGGLWSWVRSQKSVGDAQGRSLWSDGLKSVFTISMRGYALCGTIVVVRANAVDILLCFH